MTWTTEAEDRLRRMAKDGVTPSAMSSSFRTSVSSIENKLKRMGLKSARQRERPINYVTRSRAVVEPEPVTMVREDTRANVIIRRFSWESDPVRAMGREFG